MMCASETQSARYRFDGHKRIFLHQRASLYLFIYFLLVYFLS